jgi:hypothetical protein
MKLFTIGDSISQGFMSSAAARTDLCFSTLIAGALGLNPGSENKENVDYYYPQWKHGGMPANAELLLRSLNRKYGTRISGMDRLTVLHTLNRILDASEDYYEREGGREDRKYHGNFPYFHNVSTWAFEIADSWLVTPELCLRVIEKQRPIDGGDGWLAVANAAFYRTALKVLSPNLDKNYSQLDWLKHHAETEGLENLVLWLGSNNALKTLLAMETVQTPDDPFNSPHYLSHQERKKRGWNLWHPNDFNEEYTELLQRIDHTMRKHNKFKDWKVFVATIPYMTITPLLKGIGPKVNIGKRGNYYQYYTYEIFEEKFALKRDIYLKLHQVLYIDDYINEYNKIIHKVLERKNRQHLEENNGKRYFLVDLGDSFKRMDWRRNDGNPDYQFPDYLKTLNPMVNTKYYFADTEGKLMRGGLFSLDGVHPSAIGQGLIAHEFLKVMKKAGITFKMELDWPKIVRNDDLYCNPIPIMSEIYRYELLSQHLVKLLKYFL